MSRLVRINELLKREISHVLHTRFQGETVYVTVLDVDTTPNLRQAKVYYSVIGGPEEVQAAGRFFRRFQTEIRRQVSKAVVLKYQPNLTFIYDDAPARGALINQKIDELEIPDEEPEGSSPPDRGAD